MSAGTGIGEDPIGDATRRVDLQVGVLEAETGTGGIWLEDIGDLVIGGLTSSVAGLDVATSGELFLSNFGSIRLSDTTGPQIVHGGSSQGSVALLTWGAGASISSDVDNVAVVAPVGLVGLDTDAGDISLGGGAAARSTTTSRGVTAWSWKRAATSFSPATPTWLRIPSASICRSPARPWSRLATSPSPAVPAWPPPTSSATSGS